MVDSPACKDCGYVDIKDFQYYFCPYCLRQYEKHNYKFIFIMSNTDE